MHKPFPKFRVLLSPLAAAMALAVASVPAFAAETVAPALKAAMQRDLGLSPSQVAQYLKIERLADRQQKALEKQQGRNFAGSWIERKADGRFQLVVATTSIQPQKAPADVEVRQARHSFDSLKSSKARLDDVLAQGGKVPKGVYGWYVDQASNSVVVGVGAGVDAQQAGIDFVAASGADANTVRFETMAEQPTLRADVLGGIEYSWRDTQYIHFCSVGFSVTQGTNKGFVTAGHCGDPSISGPVYLGSTTSTVLGSFAASDFPAPGQSGPDYAWVGVNSAHTLRPTVSGYGQGDVTVRGNTEASVGAAICRSGRTTGWRCGTIEAKNVTITYQTGETVQNLTRTTACSEGGDSGGSFITGPGQAQGVLSGGSGSCKGKLPNRRTRSYFQPLLPILSAYGLTLKTG